MELNTMIHFGQTVQQAYDIAPDDLTNSAGRAITVTLGTVSTTYVVITTVYANDLATDIRPERGTRRVSIGLVLQDPATGDAVIAIRGTEGILATLLALDVAANTAFTDPAVYTYASPRAGDPAFARTYDHVVQRTSRMANRMDLVPKLPLPPLYEHVAGIYDLNPIEWGLPPRVLVKPEIACEHILSTYLFLLTHVAGGISLPLAPQCTP